MRINGQLFTAEFKRWVHMPQSGEPNVVSMGDESLCAHFRLSTWSADKGKEHLRDIFHPLETLLEIEECLTCSRENVAFPKDLEQIVAALKAYNGNKDITPLPHSKHDRDVGFHVR